MTDEVIYTTRVAFADCDPAGKVWFPNYYRWLDAASRHHFARCGVRWRDAETMLGVIGAPLVEVQMQFVDTARCGDIIEIVTHFSQWRSDSVVQCHRMTCGGRLILYCEEKRAFVGHSEGKGVRTRPIPAQLRRLCERH